MASFDLQGHRGARGLKPENTLPAFEVALDLGVTSIETDVHLTRDGVPIQTSTYSGLGDGEPFANRVPLLLIGVPVLHPATPAEIADIHDLQALARLLASFVEEGA